MNLPNKLTVFRIILIPLFVIVLLMDFGKYGDYIALGIFIAASVTDFLDGLIARKKNLITNFGKFMDPLADKILICSACTCLVSVGRMPAWVLIIIMAREFAISGIRLIAANDNIVISASYWGKVKTVVQMFMVGALILHIQTEPYKVPWEIFETVLIYASVVLCIISFVDYIIKNKDVLKDKDDSKNDNNKVDNVIEDKKDIA